MILIPTSKTGYTRSQLRSRVKINNIQPVGKNAKRENLYAETDVKKLCLPALKVHAIDNHRKLEYIIKNPKESLEDLSKHLEISIRKITQLKMEYEISGCIIVKSKM